MLDNIQLFSKSFNIVKKPNPEWTEKTKIYCSFELNLGFGSPKEKWENNNSIEIRHIIDFYKGYNNFIVQSEINDFKYELKEIQFEWLKSDDGIEVSIFKGNNKSKSIVLKKYFPMMSLYYMKDEFLIKILELLSDTKNEVRARIGELIYDKNNGVEYEFKIGQRVRTILNENVKTERVGIIINKWYHMKDKTNMYQILENGKKINKRYLPKDFELTE